MNELEIVALVVIGLYALIAAYFLKKDNWPEIKPDPDRVPVYNFNAWLIIAAVGLSGTGGWMLARGAINSEGNLAGVSVLFLAVVAFYLALAINRGK